MKQDLYTIQEVSSLLGVSPKTLRRWEQTGIIKPIRTAGNQRRYRLEDVKKLQRRQSLQKVKQEVRKEVATSRLQVNNILPSEPQIILPIPTTIPEVTVRQEENELAKNRPHFQRYLRPFMGATAVFLGLLVGALLWQQTGYPGLHSGSKAASANRTGESRSVLAANTARPDFQLSVNIPGLFGKKVTFLNSVAIKKALSVAGLSQLSGGIKTNNANINAGKGKITASNVIYSILPGSNITISGDKQNPKISANVSAGVSSLQGTTGAVVLANGTGISLDGLTINNTGVLSVQGSTGEVTLTGGSGIGISGTTISNTDAGSAQNIFKKITAGGTDIVASSNTDQVTFAAGSGIDITGDAGAKTITITNSGSGSSGLSGLTTNGILYATSGTTAGSTVPGATGTVLHGISAGAPVFSAVDLTADVTGILATGNGGTGVNGTATNGQVLIGNGSGYQLSTLTQGAGIGITNGAGSISIANNGVLSLTGTASQVNVSGATGAITVSLPQNIATSSTPTFASMSLTSNINELTLGSGNTGVITLGTLTSGRTYTFPDQNGIVCLDTGNCSGVGGSITGSGTTNFIPKFTSSSGLGNSSIFDNGRVAIGTVSPQGLFSVSGGVAGLALVNLNETAEQDILVGSASGTTRFVFDASGDLNIIGGSYQIGGINVLSTNTLGSGVINSSLTSVGALGSG